MQPKPKKAIPLFALFGLVLSIIQVTGLGEGRTGFNGQVSSSWMQVIWALIPTIAAAFVPKDNPFWQAILKLMVDLFPKADPSKPDVPVNPVSPSPGGTVADSIALATFKAMVPTEVRARYGTWSDFFADLLRVVMANPETFSKVWNLFLEIMGLMRANPPAGYTLVNPPLSTKL